MQAFAPPSPRPLRMGACACPACRRTRWILRPLDRTCLRLLAGVGAGWAAVLLWEALR
ncbi:hypothetical protein [Sphingomonas trueperi]|uniref:hypothetical protein n=1 Tax=Sphingomonas trueperi TaxID=53317 RepID=UPI000F13FDC6